MGTVIRRTCDEYTREPLDMMDMILIERSARVIVMMMMMMIANDGVNE